MGVQLFHPLPMSTTIQNISNKYFEKVVLKCPNCSGTGFAGFEFDRDGLKIKKPCKECQPVFKKYLEWIACGIPELYLDIDNYSKHLDKKDLAFIKAILADIKKNPMKMQMICFSSEMKGVGKTGTMVVLIKEVLKILQEFYGDFDVMPVSWVSAAFYLKKIIKGFDKYMSEDEKKEHKAFMDSIAMNPVLVMDGLADHHVKQIINDEDQFFASKMEELFRYRQESNLMTFCTSNYRLYLINEANQKHAGKLNQTVLARYGERFTGLWDHSGSFWYNWKTTRSIRTTDTEDPYQKFR